MGIPHGITDDAIANFLIDSTEDDRPQLAPGRKSVEIVIPGLGKIFYYPASGEFIAKCDRHGCKMTRRSHPTGAAAFALHPNPAKGRPLGLMMAWLEQGFRPGCDALELHRRPSEFLIDHAVRAASRRRLAEIPGGLSFMLLEHAWDPTQPLEPLGDP